MNCNKLHRDNLEKSYYLYCNNTRKTNNSEKSNNYVLNIAFPTHLFPKLNIPNSLVL